MARKQATKATNGKATNGKATNGKATKATRKASAPLQSPGTLAALKAHATRRANNPNAGRIAALKAHATRMAAYCKLLRGKPRAELAAKLAANAAEIAALSAPAKGGKAKAKLHPVAI